ncbi:hypothetical protein OV521_24510, partial [Salmonella enterica subsp. enterica serovar 1,4,[5],12:i:-]|nr:hypothetical protein [Salmonella enterica subsp. enterica serovar 1,4,[5],12:i:-]
PRFEIGRRAAQMLLNKIKNNDLNHNTIDLGYQIYRQHVINFLFYFFPQLA